MWLDTLYIRSTGEICTFALPPHLAACTLSMTLHMPVHLNHVPARCMSNTKRMLDAHYAVCKLTWTRSSSTPCRSCSSCFTRSSYSARIRLCSLASRVLRIHRGALPCRQVSSFSCVSWACKLRQLCRRGCLVCDCELLQASAFESCCELPTVPVQCNDLPCTWDRSMSCAVPVPTQSCHACQPCSARSAAASDAGAGYLKTGMSSILCPPMRSWDCMEVMRASRRRFSSFSTMNSRLRTSSAVMAASLSASARRFCSSTYTTSTPQLS